MNVCRQNKQRNIQNPIDSLKRIFWENEIESIKKQNTPSSKWEQQRKDREIQKRNHK